MTAGQVPAEPRGTIRFDPVNIWRVGFVVMALAAVALFLRFLVTDAGTVIFTLLMAWFASIAMEPAVSRLSRHLRRGLATGVVMLGVTLFGVLFAAAFGRLFIDQVAQLLSELPRLVDNVIAAVNERLGTSYKVQDILTQLNITPSEVAGYAAGIVGGVLGLLGSVVGGFFTLFTFALFTFYFSADGPRFRLYVASLFPQRLQTMSVGVWDLTASKTGGYVAARVALAAINAATTAIVFLVIGMPAWLALAIWTGLVAQFVPTIGTYIAVAPVLVGLLSPHPWIGIIALAWAVLYQQVENLTIEPRISARAVDVHPAVAFASVMLGAALFGVAGAMLAVPVCAMLIALGESRNKRYPLRPDLDPATGPNRESPQPPRPVPDSTHPDRFAAAAHSTPGG
ncbi:MAG: AI-2E family transporter [Dermatophilaceae bacterium]